MSQLTESQPSTARAALLVLAIMLSVTCAAAQQNTFTVYPDRFGFSATFVLRPSSVPNDELLQEYPASLFAGIADNGSASIAEGSFVRFNDLDGGTQEEYYVVFRREAAGGGPDMSPGGLIARRGPFTPPIYSYPGYVPELVEYETFSTPVTLPRTGSFFMGIQFPLPLSGVAWPADGLGLFSAYYDPPPTSAGSGDNPRPGAPSHSWFTDNGVAMPTTVPMTFDFGILTSMPVLSVGGIDPNSQRQTIFGTPCYGAGGMYPDIRSPGRADGVSVRISDFQPGRSQMSAVFMSRQLLPTPIPVFGPGTGNLWLDPATLITVASNGQIVTGDLELTIAMPGNVPTQLIGQTFLFQAATVDINGTIRFTNAAGVNF